jgi:hypothetical protein
MRCLVAIIIMLALLTFAHSQTGGVYDLSHNTISGGGGSQSSGGAFVLDGTVGQGIAGTSSTSSRFDVHGGFWIPGILAPTAATVSIEGRVTSEVPLRYGRVEIVLTDLATASVYTARPNAFGYFRFEQIEVAHFCLVEARSQLYTFTPPIREFQVVDSLTGIDFSAEPIQP